jgi:hypothetical protein
MTVWQRLIKRRDEMTQREIVISGEPVHSEINEDGRLRLYMCLWNDGSEIPLDWHEENADFMELKLTFSFRQIIEEMIEFNSLATEDEVDGLWFAKEDKNLVDLYKKELEKCIKRLDQIKFWEEKNDHV